MRQHTLTAIAIGGLLFLAAASPALADNVTVTVGLAAAGSETLPGGSTACPASVPFGSDGLVLLQSSTDQHCISSYEVESRHDYYGRPIPGHAVRCINRVCETNAGPAGTGGWYVTENGYPYEAEWYQLYGLEGFHADPGDRVVFVYDPPTGPCLWCI
jgi:hypothetical protein